MAVTGGHDAPYGLIEAGAFQIDSGRIAWLGATADLPSGDQSGTVTDLQGRLVTPALIDCHTHLIFGGNRAKEHEARLNGASYVEIAQMGGGINSTVLATRAASDDDLLTSAEKRLTALMSEGVGTIEIKSGYALTIEGEMRLLRLAKILGKQQGVRVKTTWLAAHVVPKDFEGNADAYIDSVVIPGLEQAHAEGLVDAVDGFCENIAFTPTQIERVFEKACDLGLPVKLHAEQLSDQKGACLAARYQALSVDHLEYLTPDDAAVLAAQDVTAVMLPGAFYTLRETQKPPVAALRAADVPMAVATDCNPGTSPIASLRLAMNMACTLFGLTPEEAFAGVTRHAAKALGLEADIGTIEVGKRAELAIWDAAHPSELMLTLGGSPLYKTLLPELA